MMVKTGRSIALLELLISVTPRRQSMFTDHTKYSVSKLFQVLFVRGLVARLKKPNSSPQSSISQTLDFAKPLLVVVVPSLLT